MTFKKFAFTLAAFALSLSANAGVILNGSAVTGFDHFEDFSTGTVTSNVTGTFGDNFLTFDNLGTGGTALVAITQPSCLFSGRGMTGKFLSIGMNAPCAADTTDVNSFSLKFGQAVSDLSWMGFNAANGTGFTVAAYKDGVAVEDMSVTFHQNNRFNGKYVQFTGSVFDELRFTETGAAQGFIGIDNMAWKNAVVTDPTDVPEPGIALLMGIGAAGMLVQRRKAKAKA